MAAPSNQSPGRAGKFTSVALNTSTWVALPATTLKNRQALAIQNNSPNDVLINFDSTVGSVGILLRARTERSYNLGENVTIFGRAVVGTPSVGVEEIS